jgi:hypothetical protein
LVVPALKFTIYYYSLPNAQEVFRYVQAGIVLRMS